MRRSPSITWDQLRVGLVIGLAVLVLGVAIYKLGQSANLFHKRYELIAYVPDANGLREGGSVMVVGVPASPVTVPLPEVQDQQVRVQGSAMFMPSDFIAATRMSQTGQVRDADFITAQFPLEEAADAFAASASGQEVKVVLIH